MTLAGWEHVYSGKVRELYRPADGGPDRLLVVATDRVSAFDHVLEPGIPDKGVLLTRLSLWWFDRLGVPNHLLEPQAVPDEVAGRAMLVKALDMYPIECVVRGYLTGSGWKDYLDTGAVCGHELPAGLLESAQLPEPIFTPSTKALEGHDENITREQAAELVGPETFAEVERISLELYGFAVAHAAARGIVIADTKFELGHDDEGRLVLGDEALTPDSSRFWPTETYRPGANPPSFDKQFVRDYLEGIAWDKIASGPALPPEIVNKTAEKYQQARKLLVDDTDHATANC